MLKKAFVQVLLPWMVFTSHCNDCMVTLAVVDNVLFFANQFPLPCLLLLVTLKPCYSLLCGVCPYKRSLYQFQEAGLHLLGKSYNCVKIWARTNTQKDMGCPNFNGSLYRLPLGLGYEVVLPINSHGKHSEIYLFLMVFRCSVYYYRKKC